MTRKIALMVLWLAVAWFASTGWQIECDRRIAFAAESQAGRAPWWCPVSALPIDQSRVQELRKKADAYRQQQGASDEAQH